jgi:hypothetical protein
MRISLRDQHGKELDFASVGDARDAPAEAMLLLARFGCLYPGHWSASMMTGHARNRERR